MRTVVYLDDEPELCELFQEEFESDQVKVEIFSSPEKAMEFVQAHPDCLALVDYRLGSTDGLTWVRSLPMTVKAYIVTGDLGIDLSRKPSNLVGVLFKPIDPQEVHNIFQSLV